MGDNRQWCPRSSILLKGISIWHKLDKTQKHTESRDQNLRSLCCFSAFHLALHISLMPSSTMALFQWEEIQATCNRGASSVAHSFDYRSASISSLANKLFIMQLVSAGVTATFSSSFSGHSMQDSRAHLSKYRSWQYVQTGTHVPE